jgi:hypothetical protein
MINLQHTIVLVLRSGKDFTFRDVELIAKHINGKWDSKTRPRIICLWDNASEAYDLGNLELIPLTNDYPGTWSRMQLYSPEMEKYRPFLYVDLDTAVITSLENIFNLIKDPTKLIVLEDFWQKGQLATGLVWFPAKCKQISDVWTAWQKSQKVFGFRMDTFLRKILGDKILYWQHLTNTIYDFKPKATGVLSKLPEDANLVCFHGKPRIHQIVESSMSLQWVSDYVNQETFKISQGKKKVTIIIPYNIDRGFLDNAIASVPEGVQLIVSQGDGNWPQNFNKALPKAEGKYIKYLHEDDMLTPNCIEDSIKAIEEQGVDFIHGNAIEFSQQTGNKAIWKPSVLFPTLNELLEKNTIHSATTMYRREVFSKVGLFNETEQVRSFEELEFNIRCLQMGMKIGYCNSTLAFYRRHPNQLIRTTDKTKRNKNRTEVIAKLKKNV